MENLRPSPPTSAPSGGDGFLAGAGEIGALIRAIDWQHTPFGELSSWPQSLRTTMSICLNSKFPIAVYWGPEYLMLYNQSLLPMVGASKHPQALGQPARIVLAEIWTIIEPLLDQVRNTGEAIWSEDLMLPLARTGPPEESYFSFTYSPIRDESSGVGGVFCAVIETTEKVIEGRRLRLLNALASAVRAPTPQAACLSAAKELEAAAPDIPFALLYLYDDTDAAALAGSVNMAADDPLVPALIHPGDAAPWHFDDVEADRYPVELAQLPAGSRGAVILPMEIAASGRRYGFLVIGLSPLLADSPSYLRFHNLLAKGVSQAVANAAKFEEERRRAEALAELDRSKTAFFSNVSHEFRTPLTLMLAPAEDALAAADSLSPEELERWKLVHRNAVRLSKLVNTLLDFSRLEAGRAEAHYQPVDLAEATAELTSMFRAAIEHGGLRLVQDLPPLGELAHVDRDMWEKVVLNLLSNALKFTFQGEIEVSLRLQGDAFELVVRDTGIGISAAELPHVFDRFYRIKGARARTHEGTGIGLALVAELARLHGGSVSAESIEGQGTAIHVRIPRGDAHLPADRRETERASAVGVCNAAAYIDETLRWHPPGTPVAVSLQASGPRERILLADDNADMRDYLARLLGEHWEVESVADGLSALRLARQKRPDLILSDVMMPGLDGFGLLHEIRNDAALRLTPVVLLSARAGEEAIAEGLSAGASDYIVKPFAARELLVRIASKLAAASVSREAREIEDAARQRLYGHFIQAPFPIAVLRGPTHITELVNPPALKAWGKDERILERPLIEGIPELQGQPFIGYLDEVYRSGVAYRAQGELPRLVRADGKLEDTYWDFVYTALRDGEGHIDGVLVCGFEVTAQVRAAQELGRLLARAEAGERQFRELVENLPHLAWTASPDGALDYYNQRWYDYTGTAPADMLGWGWISVHEPSRADADAEQWRASVASGEPFEMEYPLRRADGTFRWFLTRVRPIRDAEGRIVRWFGSSTDIDDRRRSDAFREMFLGIVSHDLRNPLYSIQMIARAMQMRPDASPELRKWSERILSSGKRMQRMIEQLLDFTHARLTDGIPVLLGAEAIDLREIVGKIAEEMRVAHPSVSIEVSVEGDCRVRIDPDRVEQVVSNLLGNAVSYGDRSRPIGVRLQAGPRVVSFSVHNHGTPIDPELLPKLFIPFARGDTARQASAGLGLGLFISESIMRAHGGSLTVESTRDDGTRFEAVFPLQPPR